MQTIAFLFETIMSLCPALQHKVPHKSHKSCMTLTDVGSWMRPLKIQTKKCCQHWLERYLASKTINLKLASEQDSYNWMGAKGIRTVHIGKRGLQAEVKGRVAMQTWRCEQSQSTWRTITTRLKAQSAIGRQVAACRASIMAPPRIPQPAFSNRMWWHGCE